MRKKIIVSIMIVIIFMLLLSQVYKYHMNHQGTFADVNIPIDTKGSSITVLYDNYRYREGISTDWGFSCLIRDNGKNIIFDTGSNPYILQENIEKLNIKPQEVDIIVLSHAHSDHINGLEMLLEQNSDIEVYLLKSFPEEFKERMRNTGARITEVDKGISISKGISVTGTIHGTCDEEALVIETDKGIILITGCSHSGINNIIDYSKKIFDDNILLAMGGFHLEGTSQDEINNVIQQMKAQGVKYVGPAHCTGSNAIAAFEKEYGDKFIKVGAGKIILIDDIK